MGRRSITKGKAFERKVARALSEASGTTVERELSETRAGNIGDLASDLPVVVQCKAGKRPSVWRALREAQEAAEGKGQFAIAALHRDGTNRHDPAEEIVAMSLADWCEILSQLRASGAW